MSRIGETRHPVESRSVSMYPSHWATVDAYAKDAGYGSTSAALRRIVEEWVQLKRDGLASDGRYRILEERLIELWTAANAALDPEGDPDAIRLRLSAAVVRTLRHIQPKLMLDE